ncbi:peptidylprolyl isomerase, partial [Bacillus spizizenii]|nr:peptidylprolyl isomerase [Bacillus spizizenii]
IWTIILGALLVCCISVAYTLTKSQAGASPSGESIATIGGKSVTREEWLKEMEDRYG